MKHFLLFILLLPTLAFAQQKPKVLIVDPDLDSAPLEKEFSIQKPAQHYALPDKDQRDLVVSGIKSVEKFDELKKDILYMDLKSLKEEDVRKKYPELSPMDIRKMKERL